MAEISRRAVLGVLSAGALGAGVTGGVRAWTAAPAAAAGPLTSTRIAAENRLPGSDAWRIGADGSVAADDQAAQVKGYTSATSVNVGEDIDFHVATSPAQQVTVGVWRLGDYGGAGARQVASSPALAGQVGAAPVTDPATGMVTAPWPPSWTLPVPASWTSGSYLAVFTTARGHRSYAPFVVRDDARPADLLVVLPFSTYQAYNQWPLDGRVGKSLYYGYGRASSLGGGADGAQTQQGIGGEISYGLRSRQVSFDRPYAGNGLPLRADLDHDTVAWIERQGYDATYATSVDLHAGRVDPARYRALVFSGHDEYWSAAMRAGAEQAVARGTSLAYLTANNVYWHVRFAPSGAGVPDRVMTCYKTDPDPQADVSGATTLWRQVAPRSARAEQALLGVQYVGIVEGFHPLVVAAPGHWLWAGTGVAAGDRIDALVGGEADGWTPAAPPPGGTGHTLVSASPFPLRSGKVLTQQASVYEAGGAVVFVAGTFNWPLGLNRPGIRDRRIERATANVFARVTGRGAV